MKLMKYITGRSAALLPLAACSKEEGPSVDDYFLSYEIPEILVTEDHQVGIFYYKGNDITTRPNGDANFTRWKLLTLTDKGLSTKNSYNSLTPQVMPESQKDGYLQLDAGSQSYRMIPTVQQHVDDCIEAGANFIILLEVGAGLDKGLGIEINQGDLLLVTMVPGCSGRGGKRLPMPHLGQPGVDFVDLKTTEIIISVSWNSIVDLSPTLSSSNCIETVAGKVYDGVIYTRQQLLNNLFSKIGCYFSDDRYYKLGGTCPAAYIRNKTDEIYVQESRAMYGGVRKVVKEATGYDIYITVESVDVWYNQMRYQYFYMEGCVDVVADRNMYGQSEMSRSYMCPQMIDQNWKYSRETALSAFGDGSMEFVSCVGPTWNRLVQDGRGSIGNTPIVKKDAVIYRTMYNVVRMSTGRNRLVLIDSYNKYNFDSFIKSTVEGHGNGYGRTYLNITWQQFKKNQEC